MDGLTGIIERYPVLGVVAAMCFAMGMLLLALRTMVKDRAVRDVFLPGRVMGVVGRMGGGKTMFAVDLALRQIRLGGRVAANFHLNGIDPEKFAFIRGWDDYLLAEDCLVIIDEAHLWAPSSHSKTFPMAARTALAFGRKSGVSTVWIAQHESRVNRTLLDLTTDMVLCSSSARRLRVEFWSIEDFRKQNKKPWLVERRRIRPDVANAYNTKEKILVDSYLDGVDASMAKVRAAENG